MHQRNKKCSKNICLKLKEKEPFEIFSCREENNIKIDVLEDDRI
jgi:hypothetical protein